MIETVRNDPWLESGTTLDSPPSSIEEALDKCGLNWTVSVRDLMTTGKTVYGHNEDGSEQEAETVIEVPGFKVVMRDDTNYPLGVVTDRYKTFQNVDGFSVLNDLIGEVEIVTAGSFDGGKTVWVLAKVPGHILVGGNPTEQFILFRNGHDGKSSAGYCLTPIIVVCKNTLSLAWSGAKNKFSMNHTGDMEKRAKEAANILGITNTYYSEYKKMGDKLALAKISDDKLLDIFMKLLYPNGVGDSERAKNSAESAKLAMEQILAGPTLGNAKGTKWGAVNAVGEYLDWYRPTRGDSDRFARINFEATNPKQKAFELILDA